MTNGHRNRGVRASRARLAHALTEAGLKTQVALAERIADIEGLDAAPKDVVNRVFRELPVDPTTIERVARALGVDAFSLYKTADEESVALSDTAAPRHSRSFLVLGVIAAVSLSAVVLGALWWPAPGETPAEAPQSEMIDEPAALGMGTPSLVVIPFSGDDNGVFGNSLRNVLGHHFNVARPTADTFAQSRNPAEVAAQLRTEVVIDGDFRQVGRLTAVRIYLFRAGVRQQVWADSAPTAALQESLAGIAVDAALAVRRAVGMPVPENAVTHFPLAPVQDDYLEGERYLEAPSGELNIKRAQSRFEAALRQDANYARAHAGLCQTLLEEHWMDSEERALRDASLACGQAVQLDPDDPVVAVAHAHFLQRTGRSEQAIELFEQMVAQHPKDSSALAGLAASQLEAYRETGEHQHLETAKATARRAAEIDPYVWKPLFSLATMEWFDGNVAGAIEASEAARARDENEYVLANLGSFYLCDGKLENAREAYARARDLNPNSYVGDEFLGQAHYFLGDFGASAELRQKAINSVASGNPEIHEMWGNLADSYRQTGATEKAISAYMRAAEIAERDYLRGTAPVADQAARAYYYTMLATLDSDAVPGSVLRTIDDEIDEIADKLVSATGLRRMAQTYLQRGESDKARATLGRATELCRGYASFPDLAELLD
jgi:tetratricopeptide (TPR) repeat protein